MLCDWLGRQPSPPREPRRGRPGAEARRDQGLDAGPLAGRGEEAPRRDRHRHTSRAPGPGALLRHALQLRPGERGPGDAEAGRGSLGWLRLHEKGGKRHDVPAHHRAAAALDEYVEAADLEEPKAGALPERGPCGAPADGPGVAAAGRPGDDQAACRGRRAAALDVLPHVSGDGGSRRTCRTRGLEHAQQIPGPHRRRRRSSTTRRRTQSPSMSESQRPLR